MAEEEVVKQLDGTFAVKLVEWVDPPEVAITEDIEIEIAVSSLHSVLKKTATARISNKSIRTSRIILSADDLGDFNTFLQALIIKCRYLNANDKFLLFADYVDGEHRFIHNIETARAILSNPELVTLFVATTNADLIKRLSGWDKVSPDVQQFITGGKDTDAPKAVSIKSEVVRAMNEKRSKTMLVHEKAAELDFTAPIYFKKEDDTLRDITVWKRYAPLFISLNSILFTIDEHFKNIGRTDPVNPDIVREICMRVLEAHSREGKEE